MTCKLCNIKENKPLLQMMKVYQDEKAIALLSKKPASICHVILFPTNHYTIIEQVPDDEIAHLFSVANKISRAMFESLNIQGTNIFVQNGVAAGQEEPHFIVHIIARTENDGIKLQWEPKKMSDEQLGTAELSYKQFTDGIVFSTETKADQKPAGETISEEREDKKEGNIEGEEDGEENYLLKYFNKMP